MIRQPGRTWTQTYDYDGVNRLTAASEPGGWSQTYGYDQYGNRWVDSTSGPPEEIHEPRYQTMFNANTNRFSVESGITYDLAGNQTYFAPWTLGYDAENRNTAVSSASSGNGVYAYDGDGRRVKKTWTSYGGSTTTYYLYNALGQLAAEYSTQSSTAGTSYIHTDMLGSTRMVTDASGATLECYDYLPFGRMLSDSINGRNTGCYPPNPDYQVSSQLPQKFTGKERDAETRLDFFAARYYSAAQGRFTAVDPLMASAKTSLPQTWNRYSYGLNNPLRFVDPTGMYICDGTDKECDDFDDTLKSILKSKDKNALRAARAYGKRGDDNGVTVGFADKLDDRGGEVDPGQLAFANDRFTATMRVLIQRDNIKNEETIAHEGSHAADHQEFAGAIKGDTGLTDLTDSLNITTRESEIRAYRLSVQYALTGNKTINFGPCGMDECKFTSSQTPAARDQLINQLLDDPRNRYKNLDKVLYPNLLRPQQK